MEADSLGWKPAFVQLLVLTGHHHHLLCFRLHGREILIKKKKTAINLKLHFTLHPINNHQLQKQNKTLKQQLRMK